VSDTLFNPAELVEQGITLLPCPFCGLVEWLQLEDDRVHWPRVQCTNCGAEMAGETRQDAANNWNQRPS